MSDFNKPVLADTYTGVLTTIRELLAIVSKRDLARAKRG